MEPFCILSRMKVWEELLDEEGRDGGCRRNAMFAPRAGVPRRLKAQRGGIPCIRIDSVDGINQRLFLQRFSNDTGVLL